MRLAAIDPVAAESGLSVGTGLADALAILPDLAVHPHDPQADAELLDRIADGCMRFTPMVAAEQPDGIMLDITGSAHLFGGEEALEAEVRGWLAERQLRARCACGFSAEAAHALARFHGGRAVDEMEAIRALPVEALQLDTEATLGLRRAGLKTVGDVTDRPRKVVAARFGTAATYRLERLVGAQGRPIAPRAQPSPRVFRRRFPEPVASKDYAIGVLRELLDEANADLARQDRGGRGFEARFCRVDGVVQRLHVETGRPTRDSAAIARLFDERLDALADPLDPGFGFDSVELVVTQADPLKARQDDFDAGAAGDNPLGETLDMLAIRLGRRRLLRFRERDTHIPEKGQVAVPVLDAGLPFAWSGAPAGEPPSRPLQLFDPPQRIAVIAEIPDGPPRRFRWQRKLRDVALHEGPERIAGEWWTGAGDPLGQGQLTRDYYRIEDTEGRRYWVFRHGLYGRESDDPDWYLHGLFA